MTTMEAHGGGAVTLLALPSSLGQHPVGPYLELSAGQQHPSAQDVRRRDPVQRVAAPVEPWKAHICIALGVEIQRHDERDQQEGHEDQKGRPLLRPAYLHTGAGPAIQPSAVAGSTTNRTAETRLAGKPASSACRYTVSASDAMYTQ